MRVRIASTMVFIAAAAIVAWGGESTLVIDSPEMAGISGFREYWDRPVVVTEDGATRMKNHGHHGGGLVADWSTDQPGAPVFDAVHRSLLVRFPEAAEKIAEQLRKGNTIKRAELVFTFVDTEYFPLDYMMPAGMSFLGDLWVRVKPRWHAVAWALRKPWQADARRGPTFNANVNGIGYWHRFGAQDQAADRFATQFGPTEVSYKATEGRLDVTAALNGEAFGKTLSQRLRQLSDQGFLVRKWETYDARFNHGGYEYGGAPGCRGIRVKAPKLVITFAPGKADLGEVPPSVEIRKLKKAGQPTAVMPNEEQIREYTDRFRLRRPVDMPRWQWERVNDLFRLARHGKGGFPETVEAYVKWIDHYNSLPYRQFRGHHTPLTTHTYLLYSEAMPEPVREHMRRYWEAWLMPGRPYHELEHNQWGIWTKPENNYYARTGDWRGNHSFYRESYCRFMSTMNFNHLAAAAALFGGSIIGDEESMKDGRYGLEHWLLRLWSWYDGTTQESIDHYYLGLTLINQKSFVDLGPTVLDRMMGTSILMKAVEELAGCYHPALRRFITTSGRTGIAYLFAINEGPNYILHTISRKGAVHDMHNPDRRGMPVSGYDLPPDLVARQQLIGPWAPRWMGDIVDSKPLPFEITTTFKMWGAYLKTPLWKRSYQGRHYGLATLDVATSNQTVPVMAQWRRRSEQADNLQDIGTLLMRYGINWTEFYDSLYHGTTKSNANGSVGTQGGHTVALQHKNKAIVLTSPYLELKYPGGRPIPEDVHSLQASIALANYAETPTWKVFVDGKPILSSGLDGKSTPTNAKSPAGFRTPAFSVKAKQTSRITIQDGVSFIGIIPIPSTDLGRTEEIVITDGGERVDMQGGGKAAPTLVINNYNFYNEKTPLDKQNADWKGVDRAYGGFVIEVADISEYSSFDDFQEHIREASLELSWDDAAGLLHLDYESGDDLMELGYLPEYGGSWNKKVSTDQCFPYRRVNGRWPYLPKGLERDSTVSQQGRTGRLEKNGAVLAFQPGRMGYLLTEPTSQTYLFSNPLPDTQYMVMDAPGGIRIKADGKLGLTRVTVMRKENRVEVSYAAADAGDLAADMATALFVFGCESKPEVVRNGDLCSDVRLVELDMRGAWMIPLSADAPYRSVEAIRERYERSSMAQLVAMSALTEVRAEMKYLPGQEHYQLTEPRSGAIAFTRMWPMVSPIEATVPGRATVATDGNLALQRLTISKRERRIEIDYAPYLQKAREGQPLENRAKALLVFGMDRAPSALLHGKEYEGKVESVTIDGQAAHIIPLFGDEPTQVKKGLERRYRRAMAALATEK